MELIHALQRALLPSSGWEQAWLLVTSLSSEYAFIVFLAVSYWLLGPRLGRKLGLTVAVSFLLNDALKGVFNSNRPYVDDPRVASAAAQATGPGGGLPSGHTQSAASFWTLLAWERGGWWVPVAVVVILAVSLSRLVLGVHYPLDVLAGLFVGLALAFGAAGLPVLPGARMVGWVVALLSAYLAARWLPDSSRSLGVLAGFALSVLDFRPPRGAARALIAVVGGLLLVGVLYLALSGVLGAAGHTGLGGFAKYLLLTLAATEFWPRLCLSRGWLEPLDARKLNEL